jgi:MFS transporter, OFA family, oxalate/formate antiporter
MKKFYCWFILACLFIVYMASNGMVLNTFTQYTPELMKYWKLDFKGASSFQSTIYFVLALPLPFVGLLLQRSSPKKLMLYGAVGMAASLLIFANAGSIGMMRLFTILFPLCLSAVGLLTCMYLINNWFSKYRGIATGILLMGSSVGPALFAPILGKWLATIGWQKAATYEAIICSLLIFIPALFIKNHPTDAGTWADGIAGNTGGQPKVDAGEAKAQFKKAIHSLNFYLVVIVTAVLWFCIGGLFVHHGLYLKELKLDAAKAGQISGLFFLCSLVGKLVFGFISDKFDVKKIMLVSVFNMLLGCLLLWLSVKEAGYMIPYAVVLGAGYSGTFTMIQLYAMRLYGGPAYGSILGLLSFVDTICLALGGMLFGIMRKTGSDYSNPFLLMIILTALSLLATFIINRRTNKAVY